MPPKRSSRIVGTLAWAAVSAFAAFDLGIGRATSFLVADRTARGATSEIPSLLAAAGWTVWLVAGPVAIVGVALAPWLVRHALDIPPALHAEATTVVRLIAVSLPIVIHGIIQRSAFEGVQRFAFVNALRIPLGVVTWGGPWVASFWTTDLRVLVGVIVGGRVLYWVAQGIVIGPRLARPAFGALFRAGGWMTLSGVVAPIVHTADRALVPLLVPIATVAWYVAAGEGATKLLLVPAALQPVLFPALAAAAAGGASLVADLIRRAVFLTAGVLVVPTLILFATADPLMAWWLGQSAVPEAALVFRLFLVACFLNSLAHVAYSALQAGGEAKAAARLHLIELPLYLALLAVTTTQWGAVGAAIAWSTRMIVDAALMWVLAWRLLPGARAAFNRGARPA